MKPSAGKLIVTGAAGFIGSRFVERCNETGIDIVSVDELKHFAQRPELSGLDFGETVDRDALFSWLRGNGKSVAGIMHLGACTDTTELDEGRHTRMNYDYSKQLWEFASEQKIPFVYASSAATYGDGLQGYDDDEQKIAGLKPLNPYGDSKQRFDLWALDAERRGAKPPTWSGFKFFNVYGFGERHKGKMASVVLHSFEQIRQTASAKLFKSYRPDFANGYQKRDFIYVGDVVDVLWFALQKPITRGIYNLGTGKARTFLDLVRAVFHELGTPENINFIEMPKTIADRYQYFTEAKMDKLRAQGYTQKFRTIEEGVHEYVTRLRKTLPK